MSRRSLADQADVLLELLDIRKPDALANNQALHAETLAALDDAKGHQAAALAALKHTRRNQDGDDRVAALKALKAGKPVAFKNDPISEATDTVEGAKRVHRALEGVEKGLRQDIRDELLGPQFMEIVAKAWARSQAEPAPEMSYAEVLRRHGADSELRAIAGQFVLAHARVNGADPGSRLLKEVRKALAAGDSRELPTIDVVKRNIEEMDRNSPAAKRAREAEARREEEREANRKSTQERTQDRRKLVGLDEEEEEAA